MLPESVEAEQTPRLTFKALQELGCIIQMYPIHPEAMRAISKDSKTLGDLEHIEAALRNGQTEFLLIPVDIVPPEKLGIVTEMLHVIRGKTPPKHTKPDNMYEKGYMLVHEPEAIAFLKQHLKGSYITTESRRSPQPS